MAAVANSTNFEKKVDVPQSEGKDFAEADKRKEDEEDKDEEETFDEAVKNVLDQYQ